MTSGSGGILVIISDPRQDPSDSIIISGGLPVGFV